MALQVATSWPDINSQPKRGLIFFGWIYRMKLLKITGLEIECTAHIKSCQYILERVPDQHQIYTQSSNSQNMRPETKHFHITDEIKYDTHFRCRVRLYIIYGAVGT